MADKLALRARSVRKLRPCSGCAVVVPQQTAQPLTATHAGAPERAGLGHNQLVAEPLMVSLQMVVCHELVEDIMRRACANRWMVDSCCPGTG